MTHTMREAPTGIDAAAAAMRIPGAGAPEKRTEIAIQQIDPDADWLPLAGRLVVRWDDSIEYCPLLLVTGTDDPGAALRAELDDWSPDAIDRTDWSQSIGCYRVRSLAEIMARGYDREDALAAYGDCDSSTIDDWLESLAHLSITLEPEEPPCQRDRWERPRKKHKWIDGQAYGHGGGIQRADRCKRCGVERHVDTWATDPVNGSQGHTSLHYERDGERLTLPAVMEVE